MKPEAIISQVKDGNLLLQLALEPESRSRYDFPFLREMPTILLQQSNQYIETLIYGYSFQANTG